MLGPRKRPTSCQPGEIARPSTGRPPRAGGPPAPAPRPPPPAGGEHVGALVDADDRAAMAAHELHGDGCGAGRDVEDAVAGAAVDSGDEEAPPARVLAEAEEGGVAVVRGGEGCEQRECVAIPLAERVVHGAIVLPVGLEDEIRAAFEAALAFAREGEEITGVLPTEPGRGARVYLCSYERDGTRSWLALGP